MNNYKALLVGISLFVASAAHAMEIGEKEHTNTHLKWKAIAKLPFDEAYSQIQLKVVSLEKIKRETTDPVDVFRFNLWNKRLKLIKDSLDNCKDKPDFFLLSKDIEREVSSSKKVLKKAKNYTPQAYARETLIPSTPIRSDNCFDPHSFKTSNLSKSESDSDSFDELPEPDDLLNELASCIPSSTAHTSSKNEIIYDEDLPPLVDSDKRPPHENL